MTFNWDINKWVETLIPAPVRKQPLTDYLLAALVPLVYLYGEFMTHRAYLLKKIKFNGQVIVMENLLNDTFDEILRRIRIITIEDLLRKKYIGQVVEAKPLWIAQPSENQPQYIGQLIEYQNNGGFDFIVEVPMGTYSSAQLIQIKKMTNLYKLGGKRAKFIYQNGQEF